MRPSLFLPPLECCRGTRPSQAESCRPEARMGKAGKREYVQVLRLLESFRLEELTAAVDGFFSAQCKSCHVRGASAASKAVLADAIADRLLESRNPRP